MRRLLVSFVICNLAVMGANAVADSPAAPNLLSGLLAQTSSVYDFIPEVANPATLTNGLPYPNEFAFSDFDTNQQLVFTGINAPSGITQVRLCNHQDRFAQQVTIMSSMNNVGTITNWSTASTLFETLLASTWPVEQGQELESIISVAAPVGTQSLYFSFGDTNSYGSVGPWTPPPDWPWPMITYCPAGVALVQVQALDVPEPSSIALLTIGAISLIGYAWRRQRAG